MDPASAQRFLAYAFSVGDVFLELDTDARIASVEGAAQWLGAKRAEDLLGRPVYQLLDEDDATVLRCSLRVLEQARRLGPILVECGVNPAVRRPVGLYLASLPDGTGHVHVVVVSQARLGSAAASESGGVPAMDIETFLGRLKDLAAQESGGRPLMISLLRVDEARLPGDRDAFTRQLAALSADGRSATRLSEGRYALLHEAGDGGEATDLLRETLAEATGQHFQSATLPVAEMELSDADAARAAVYSIRKFADESEEMDLEHLATHCREEIGRARQRVHRFRKILKERRFSLAFQPVVRLADRSLQHVEALARFDARGETTAEMIAFAEDVGMIIEFDLAVLTKVTSVLAHAGGRQASTIAVNVSGRSLSTPAFARALDDMLSRSHRYASRLLFEITESARITDLEAVGTVVQRIRDAGHPVCLDDFGAGLAGYQYLRHLAVDYVKLDGSYVRQALDDFKTRAFLHSMATLCQDLGIATIAECVETEAEAAMVKRLGVEYGQGFLFGPPQHKLPAEMRTKPAAARKAASSRPATSAATAAR